MAKDEPEELKPEDTRYDACQKSDVLALWAKCGREAVKGVPGFHKMTLGEIAKALGK